MSSPGEKSEPHYDLDDVKLCCATGELDIPRRVRRYMGRQEWVDADLAACIATLRASDFHKSQKHSDRPGVWLDIYRPRFEGSRRYLKLTVRECGRGYVVLSFCRDGQAH